MPFTAMSAAEAGAPIPRASKPTAPIKNFFITQSPIVMRFVEADHFRQECPSNFRRDFQRNSSRALYPKYKTPGG